MGRNLWINSLTLSRDFTSLIWDDLLDLFPPRPDPLTPHALRGWLVEVSRAGAERPILYQVWRARPDGLMESDVAYAWHKSAPIQVEGCYDSLTLRPLGRMPELDYQPPEWLGAERFAEAFRGTPLSLQAEPLALYFSYELEQLDAALKSGDWEWGILG